MNKIVKNLVVATAVVAASSAMAGMGDEISPFVGAEFKQMWMKGSSSNANIYDKTFPESYPGANIFAGAKFHENFGVEAGWDIYTNKKKEATVLGTAFTTKVRLNGGHLGLNGYVPLSEGFELLGSLGLGFLKADVKTTPTGVAEISSSTKTRMIPRIGAGLQYMVTPEVGIRGLLRWEGTSQLRMKDADATVLTAALTAAGNAVTKDNVAKPFKDAVSVSIGAFFKF